MNPKDVLREEHGETMKMLLVLQRFSANLVNSKVGQARDLQALIEFFELYVDQCHHGKEEQLLFPALARTRSSEVDSLIVSLIHDHRQARILMEQLKSDAGTFYSRSGIAPKAFSDGAERYVGLVRNHIRRENSSLLPLIEESLSETDRLQMAAQFQELDNATLGSSRREDFLDSVQELSQRYAPEKI